MPAIELSKPMDDSSRKRWPGAYTALRACVDAIRLWCSIITPFGVPVEPEV